jgi:RimJ/RimL family protein N-acetyltransferase
MRKRPSLIASTAAAFSCPAHHRAAFPCPSQMPAGLADDETLVNKGAVASVSAARSATRLRDGEAAAEHDFGLSAIEVPGVAPFVGFAGLAIARFNAHFTPCVEIGWRLAFDHWEHGYATEAARLVLGYGFGPLALPQIVSFTTVTNYRSRAVMERLRMRRDPADDFDYPSLPANHPLRRHVLYRLASDAYFVRS